MYYKSGSINILGGWWSCSIVSWSGMTRTIARGGAISVLEFCRRLAVVTGGSRPEALQECFA